MLATTLKHNDDWAVLVKLFDQLFFVSDNTKLESGTDEPIYLPSDSECNYHRVIFAHGFFASALHEISHWCVAGSERRKLIDYGYWYQPDGRTASQQASFEKVEVKLLADDMKVILDQRSYYKRLASRAGSKDRLKGILLESDISRH